MTSEREFSAWLVEGRWGNNEIVYLASLGDEPTYFFGWVREPWRAIKFSDWDSADDCRKLAGNQLRVVHDCKTLIAEHRFRGDGGAKHDSVHIERTGRTQ